MRIRTANSTKKSEKLRKRPSAKATKISLCLAWRGLIWSSLLLSITRTMVQLVRKRWARSIRRDPTKGLRTSGFYSAMARLSSVKTSLLWRLLQELPVLREPEQKQSSSIWENKSQSRWCSRPMGICRIQRIVQITPRQDLKACKQSFDPQHKLESAIIRQDHLQNDY